MNKVLVSAAFAVSVIAAAPSAQAAVTVTLANPSCSLVTGCLFNGNDDQAGGDVDIETAYNAAFPSNPIDLIKLSTIQSGSGVSGKTGTYTYTGPVSFYSVKGSTSFMLYSLSPASNIVNWTTLGLVNGGGKQPDISHLTLWTTKAAPPPPPPPPGGVPEPATWAMMIIGFGATGSMVRSARRRQAYAIG